MLKLTVIRIKYFLNRTNTSCIYSTHGIVITRCDFVAYGQGMQGNFSALFYVVKNVTKSHY
jgi:hypothetical protein